MKDQGPYERQQQEEAECRARELQAECEQLRGSAAMMRAREAQGGEDAEGLVDGSPALLALGGRVRLGVVADGAQAEAAGPAVEKLPQEHLSREEFIYTRVGGSVRLF